MNKRKTRCDVSAGVRGDLSGNAGFTVRQQAADLAGVTRFHILLY